uniref:Erythroblast membrane associated protein (Scianna blood group) n=1 Tax=Rhinolophus ferrumequinum TaxID=59479 RepID=A0A671E7F1_RHIFE
MERARSSDSWLSSCLITLVCLQLPMHMALSLFVCTAGDLSKFHLAPLGGTAELLCPVSSWPSTTLTEVWWLRSPPPGRSQVVHLFQDGKDREEDVMPEYKGRTEMARDDQEGNITLKIHHVRLEDKGLYRCQVQIGNRSREGTVTLQVAVLGSAPYIHVKGYNAGWIQLVCRSVGWFPKPWAQWRDPQGRVLPSELEAYSPDDAGLFQTALSSRVRDSAVGNVSCTVRSTALGQEKTAAMLIAAPPPERVSSTVVALAMILPLLGLLIVMGICIIWKQRKAKDPEIFFSLQSYPKILEDIAFPSLTSLCLSAVAVTLDPDTAHPKLLLSEDGRSVTLGDRRQPVPDNPQRFDFVVSVLGAEYFMDGCHYWEVYVGNKTKWILGVCSESVSRKGKVTASPANGHWLVRLSRGNEYEALTSPQTSFRLKEPPRCVGIFLDYEAGVISFYNVTNQSHIFTFTHTFSGPLRPFFEPCLHDGGKNTAPLVICSELQKPEEPTVPKPEEKSHANGDMALKVDSSLLPPPAPELPPLKDMIQSWPSDMGPALQGLEFPPF